VGITILKSTVRVIRVTVSIAAHESPYMNKGNFRSILEAGMTFTSEPGVYLVDEFGVRHEDVLLVQEDGDPILLTGQRAQGPWDP
jgi:Xaa-Pro aminopeptidase